MTVNNSFFDEIFLRKKLNEQKLLSFGFVKDRNTWTWQTKITNLAAENGEFLLFIKIDSNGNVDTNLTEKATGEPYILYKTTAQGAFIGEIREEIRAVLQEIAENCFEPCIFKSYQAQKVIEFVSKTYGDELEFLWEKFPENAIWRKKDNQKWYGAILTVKGTKIGLNTDRIVEIIDLRMEPTQCTEILSRPNYLPGWHMNKKSWFTIVLDGSVPDEELFTRIKESYKLAK